jgi:hypothetical protein
MNSNDLTNITRFTEVINNKMAQEQMSGTSDKNNKNSLLSWL